MLSALPVTRLASRHPIPAAPGKPAHYLPNPPRSGGRRGGLPNLAVPLIPLPYDTPYTLVSRSGLHEYQFFFTHPKGVNSLIVSCTGAFDLILKPGGYPDWFSLYESCTGHFCLSATVAYSPPPGNGLWLVRAVERTDLLSQNWEWSTGHIKWWC